VSIFKIDFEAMAWQDARPGVRYKVYSEGSRQIRLVEFATTEGDPHWCELGHIGFVLEGGLKIDVNGKVLSFSAGDGLFIPPGAASSHRGLDIAPGTRLVMVEDVGDAES
jgi:quercetin dioxygenase-like cupin family protein